MSTRQELIDYCLRRLGEPVIEVNVDDDQVSDRIDDALQHWNEYHFDGTERTYVKHKLTGSTLTLTASATFTAGETIEGGTSGAKAKVHKSSSGTSVVYEKTTNASVFKVKQSRVQNREPLLPSTAFQRVILKTDSSRSAITF